MIAASSSSSSAKVTCVEPPPRSRATTVFSDPPPNLSTQQKNIIYLKKILTLSVPKRKLTVNQEKSPSSVPSMMEIEWEVL